MTGPTLGSGATRNAAPLAGRRVSMQFRGLSTSVRTERGDSLNEVNRRRNTPQTRRAAIFGTVAILAGLGTAYLAAWAAMFVIGDTT